MPWTVFRESIRSDDPSRVASVHATCAGECRPDLTRASSPGESVLRKPIRWQTPGLAMEADALGVSPVWAPHGRTGRHTTLLPQVRFGPLKSYQVRTPFDRSAEEEGR